MFYLRTYVKDYVSVLVKQIEQLGRRKFKTIYIGGGTPTSLNNALLEKLLRALSLHLKKDNEFSVEVNVETLNNQKLELLKKYGVNRVSIGVQTFDNELLKSLNRYHNKRQVIYWINKFRKIGINNINIDLIYGLPHQTLECFQKDLEILSHLPISHVSSYSLTVSKGTVFYNRGIKEIDDDKSRAFYDLLYHTLKQNGFKRYEVSNFAKGNCYSRHNLCYWKGKEYVGLGLGAHGYENEERYQNTLNIHEYLKGHYIASKELLTKRELLEEYVMLNLRLEKGINKKSFFKLFKKPLDYYFPKTLKKYLNNKLLKDNKTSIKASYEGVMLLDKILIDMFLELE